MKYARLNGAGKERARAWYREASMQDEWWDGVYEDAVTCLGFLGFDATETKTRRNQGGTYLAPTIEFSGFSSQGDGACFHGDWAAKNVSMAGLDEHVGSESAGDKTLRDICAELSVIALQFPDMTARIVRMDSRYSHPNTMVIENEEFGDGSDDGEWTDAMSVATVDVQTLAKRAADWIYRQLEQEYEYQNSDECVIESIEANDYDFYADGSVK